MNATFRLMNEGTVGPVETVEVESHADLRQTAMAWAKGQIGWPWDVVTITTEDGYTDEVEL